MNQRKVTYRKVNGEDTVTDNLLEKWIESLDITPEDVKNGEYDKRELKSMAEQDMTPAMTLRWLSLYLPSRRDLSYGKASTNNSTYVLCRTVQLVEALEHYKEQVKKLKEKQKRQRDNEKN